MISVAVLLLMAMLTGWLAWRGLQPLGRIFVTGAVALGLVAGALRDAVTGASDDSPSLSLGFALVLLAVLVSTGGRPERLVDGNLRRPPVAEARSRLLFRQVVFALTMTILLAVWLWSSVE